MNPLTALIGPVVDAVSNVFVKRTERKQTRDTLRNKAAMQKVDAATQVTLTDSEWETVAKGLESGSLKDEYVTVLGTWPLAGIMLGALVAALTGDTAILDGTVEGIRILNEVGVPMPEIMTGVVFAAIGLKLWRS